MDQHEKDPIAYLMRRKFPSANRMPRIHDPRFPYETPLEHKSPEAVQHLFNLKLMTPAQLRQAAAEERAREVAEWTANAAEDDRTQFFNHPSAEANFDHWARLDFWTLDEALALSFGKAPEVLTKERVQRLGAYSPFAVEYRRRAEVARRAVIAKQMWESVPPAYFLRWAQRKGMNPPEALLKAVEAGGGRIEDWKDAFDRLKEAGDTRAEANERIIAARESQIAALQKQIEVPEKSLRLSEAAAQPPTDPETPLKTRERESLLRLIIGMAVRGYSYDPKAGRSPVPSEIASDLELLGIGLDPDTVRKYLAEAKQLLPPSD